LLLQVRDLLFRIRDLLFRICDLLFRLSVANYKSALNSGAF